MLQQVPLDRGAKKKECGWRIFAGVALRRILRILRINIRLYGFIQSLSVLSTEKISCKNPLVKRIKQRVRLVDYTHKKRRKKGPSNDKFSEGTSPYAETWRDLHIIFNCSCFTSLRCLLPRPRGGGDGGAAFGFDVS